MMNMAAIYRAKFKQILYSNELRETSGSNANDDFYCRGDLSRCGLEGLSVTAGKDPPLEQYERA